MVIEMQCPICHANTEVEKEIDKSTFILRIRRCASKNCNHKFKTKELEASEWNYRSVVRDIKDILKDVKI